MNTTTGPKAIPTWYNRRSYRSRLEADFARMLDVLNIRFDYEPQSFLLGDGTHYLPDFWCPDLWLWAECRGYDSENGRRQIDQFSCDENLILRTRDARRAQESTCGTFDQNRAVQFLVVGTSGCHLYKVGEASWAHLLTRCRYCNAASFGTCAETEHCGRCCQRRLGPGRLFPDFPLACIGGKLGVWTEDRAGKYEYCQSRAFLEGLLEDDWEQWPDWRHAIDEEVARSLAPSRDVPPWADGPRSRNGARRAVREREARACHDEIPSAVAGEAAVANLLREQQRILRAAEREEQRILRAAERAREDTAASRVYEREERAAIQADGA
ncbi:MAG: hypothetical protein FJ034_08110 [Chloroflexi bacterium]|nr:hypothetical protein [Chloroflexota bacterium]